jgi:hypothetical protein
MSYPSAIIQVFKGCFESVYFIRFIDYIITKRFGNKYYFDIKGHKASALISGILEDNETKEKYYSFAEFYNSITGASISKYDEEIFHHIYFQQKYNLHRLLCILKDDDIINFTDKKYRVFCMFRDLRDRLKHYQDLDGFNNLRKKEIISWNNIKFSISLTMIKECDNKDTDDNSSCDLLLEVYETGVVTDLYYMVPDTKEFYKISS